MKASESLCFVLLLWIFSNRGQIMITALFLFFFFLKINTFQNSVLSGSLEMVWRIYTSAAVMILYSVRIIFLFNFHSLSLPLHVAYLGPSQIPFSDIHIQARLRFDSQPRIHVQASNKHQSNKRYAEHTGKLANLWNNASPYW